MDCFVNFWKKNHVWQDSYLANICFVLGTVIDTLPTRILVLRNQGTHFSWRRGQMVQWAFMVNFWDLFIEFKASRLKTGNTVWLIAITVMVFWHLNTDVVKNLFVPRCSFSWALDLCNCPLDVSPAHRPHLPLIHVSDSDTIVLTIILGTREPLYPFELRGDQIPFI